jgi:hypothetical protein
MLARDVAVDSGRNHQRLFWPGATLESRLNGGDWPSPWDERREWGEKDETISHRSVHFPTVFCVPCGQFLYNAARRRAWPILRQGPEDQQESFSLFRNRLHIDSLIIDFAGARKGAMHRQWTFLLLSWLLHSKNLPWDSHICIAL